MTQFSNKAPTALASWMRGLARELELRNLDTVALFAEAGLDHALLDSAEARYPVQATTQLWNRAVALTGDETLGLRAIRHITPATFHAVGLSVMASETIEQAFGRMSRFVDLVTDASQISLKTTDDEFIVELQVREGAQPAHQSTDGFMCMLANGGKGLGDASLVPQCVELTRPAPSQAFVEVFEKAFACPIHFERPVMRIVFSLETARRRLKGANPLIAEHLDQASQAAMERLKPVNSMARTVRLWAAVQLEKGAPGIEEAAAHVNMSARNLQRKLAEEGTSLAAIIDDIRQREASRRLKTSQDPITAIALDLGFSDASAFSRACKRWFGKSPSDLRR